MKNILVWGNGGREHSLIRSLASSPLVEKVFALPGRKGFAQEAHCLPSSLQNKEAMKTWLKQNPLDMVLIGPERELSEGWSDFFRDCGVAVFGPSQKASQLESSKIFAKNFMHLHDIPTSSFKEVRSVKESLTVCKNFTYPLVLKACGLAGGKGVFICHTEKDLKEGAIKLFDQKVFGSAGDRALVEEFQTGKELSLFVLTNGEGFKLLPFARDFKKRFSGDKGPNTGGMGAVAPHHITDREQQQIMEHIIRPTIKGLKTDNLFYRGLLYVGLIMTKKGPVVLEYNVRFGDPETQAVLPLLEGDWAEVFLQVAGGVLPPLKWKSGIHACCVVLVHPDYPKPNLKPVVLGELPCLNQKEAEEAWFLHCGTGKNLQGQWITDGGRVLNAIGVARDRKLAVQKAYQKAATVKNLDYRKDIG